MENRRSIAIRAQAVQQPAVSPTKEALFGSGKKAGAARNHSRKALADKTNESPTSGFTPPVLKEGDRVSYKGTPYPKLLDVWKGTLPVEQVSRNLAHPSLLHKVETAEYSLHRVPKTPGELAAPTPANTPINIPLSFNHSSRTPPCFAFAPAVFEEKPDVTMSPDQEEAMNTNNMAPTPASTPINVSSSFDNSALPTPCPTIAPVAFAKKTDITLSPHQEDLNADYKSNGSLAAESSVQCMENRQWQDTAEDGEFLPLDLELLYMIGKAAVDVPSTPDSDDDDDNKSCFTEPGALDINVLQRIENVLWKLGQNPTSSAGRRDEIEGVLTTSAARVGKKDVEDIGKCVDDDDDDDDDASECSVVVNVSSPQMPEKSDPPSSNCSTTDNRRDSSSRLLEQRHSSSKNIKIDEEGFEEYNYYEEENDYGEYEDGGEPDGECDELCDAINQFTINEKDGVRLPIPQGQHVRFNYNSEDMEGEVITAEPPHQGPESPTILHLKGLPTLKGTYLRFTKDIASFSV